MEHFGTRPADYPGAESYYASCLSLPLFPSMEESDVDRVVAALAVWVEAP
jgi:dTDP-4-amino-4,6-dideoxygalactose transaminase